MGGACGLLSSFFGSYASHHDVLFESCHRLLVLGVSCMARGRLRVLYIGAHAFSRGCGGRCEGI